MTKVYILITDRGAPVVKQGGIVEKEGDLGSIVEAAYAEYRTKFPNRSLFEEGVNLNITTSPPS